MRDYMHARRVEPHEEGLAILFSLVDEVNREVPNFVVNCFHPLWVKRTRVLDLLLSDLAPARLGSRIVRGRRPAMHHVSRSDGVQQILGVVRMGWIFHCI